MNTPFDTIREALTLGWHQAAGTSSDWFTQALEAVRAIEADHFTSADMASAAAQGYRDGVASVQQAEAVPLLTYEETEAAWNECDYYETKRAYFDAGVHWAQKVVRAKLGVAVPPGYVADKSFRWDGEKQQHIPQLTLEFEPVPANGPCDAKGWKDRDTAARMFMAQGAKT